MIINRQAVADIHKKLTSGQSAYVLPDIRRYGNKIFEDYKVWLKQECKAFPRYQAHCLRMIGYLEFKARYGTKVAERTFFNNHKQ